MECRRFLIERLVRFNEVSVVAIDLDASGNMMEETSIFSSNVQEAEFVLGILTSDM